jgi:hypothetical protein
MKQKPKYFPALLASVPALLAWAAPAAAEGNIVVAAPATEAFVMPRAPDSKLVNLPPLSFDLRAAFTCRGEPASLTLSIADTFQTLGSEILAGQRAAELTLTVPPQQLPLAADSRFCIAGDANPTDRLLVPGLVNVHASLRCETPDGSSVHYASAPLKAQLVCNREPAAAQDESVSSADR